jgi:hypothetical protein
MENKMETETVQDDDVIERLDARLREMDAIGFGKSEPPYSWLGSDFFSEHSDTLATILPVFALARLIHHRIVERLASVA